jgi:hypothetical protein
MGFNKKIVGELQIQEIEMNPENIRYYLNADTILFSSKKIEIKFKEYEKQYRPE